MLRQKKKKKNETTLWYTAAHPSLVVDMSPTKRVAPMTTVVFN